MCKTMYIVNGDANPDTKIKDCLLFEKEQIYVDSDKVVRLNLPDDVKLIKKGEYKGIQTRKTLQEVDYDVLFMIDGKWTERNDLKSQPLYKGTQTLFEEGYSCSPFGFVKRNWRYRI